MKIFIVAEIGINHNGNLDTARKLVDVAIDAGCDAVKFQTFWDIPDLHHLTFSRCEWRRLILFCELRKIKWFSTPFEWESVEFLDDLGMDTWKLPSNKRVLNDGSIMQAIKNAKSRRHTIISTGISDFGEIADYILYFNDRPVTLLHCVSKYPTPIKELNIKRIERLKERFDVPVGFSDHSLSIFAAPLGAIMLGATIIEKHITLDRKGDGPDHKASIEPLEFKSMIEHIRACEDAAVVSIKLKCPHCMKWIGVPIDTLWRELCVEKSIKCPKCGGLSTVYRDERYIGGEEVGDWNLEK